MAEPQPVTGPGGEWVYFSCTGRGPTSPPVLWRQARSYWDHRSARLSPTFDATATRQKNAERLLKKRKNVRRLNAQLLRKVKGRACAAVSGPNYLYWSTLKAPPASLEPRLCRLKRSWAGGQSA